MTHFESQYHKNIDKLIDLDKMQIAEYVIMNIHGVNHEYLWGWMRVGGLLFKKKKYILSVLCVLYLISLK